MMVATMFIASIVATSAAIAGDVMQDLKTGHMVGATPWRQQTAEIVGVVVGALVIGPVLSLLHKAFRITRTACEANPLSADPNCENALEAPQAELIGAIVKGAFGGDINLPMVLLGAVIAVILIRLAMPVMSVAIGMYLPLYLSVSIMAGGIISHILLSSARIRIDGNLDGKPSKEAEFAVKEVQDKGVLVGAGFIAGESLMGVLVAIFIGANKDPSSWFGGISMLGGLASIAIFAWFTAVFIMLSARALPDKGSLANDVLYIASDAAIRLKGAFTLPAIELKEGKNS